MHDADVLTEPLPPSPLLPLFHHRAYPLYVTFSYKARLAKAEQNDGPKVKGPSASHRLDKAEVGLARPGQTLACRRAPASTSHPLFGVGTSSRYRTLLVRIGACD